MEDKKTQNAGHRAPQSRTNREQGAPRQNYYQGQGAPRQNHYQGQGAPQQNYYQGQGNPQQNYYQNQGNPQQSYYQSQGNPQQGYYQGGPQGYYEQPQSDRRNDKKKKKKKRRKWVFVLEILVLLILALGLFAVAQLGRMDREKLGEILVNTGIQKSGYRNLALFGVDARHGEIESGTNSDTIMVCSINQKTGEIKLVSVYRDTYLDITNGSYSKANSAYAGGGGERAINMLNKNLDLDITDFATVDFSAVIKAVDLLGGVDIDLTDEELKWLNAYLVETSQVTGVSYEEVPASGMQHLSGIQAMAYCRIRYTEGWDYRRTERQRTVLEKILGKAKEQGVTGLIGLVDVMLPYINTSLSNAEIVSLASGVAKYNIGESIGFPYEKQGANIAAGDCVVPVNLAANVSRLHEELFGEVGYTPSQTVQEISNKIISDTGIQ